MLVNGALVRTINIASEQLGQPLEEIFIEEVEKAGEVRL
jgi:hypothetical protein